MIDKKLLLSLIRDKFQDPSFHIDIVGSYIQRYEEDRDPDKRDAILMSLWNASLRHRWAWDVLIELCRRTKFEAERPRFLNDFAISIAIGDRNPPDKRRGHPVNNFDSDWRIYLTFQMLVNDLDFSNAAAYRKISEWSKRSPLNYITPDGVRKLVEKIKAQWPE